MRTKRRKFRIVHGALRAGFVGMLIERYWLEQWTSSNRRWVIIPQTSNRYMRTDQWRNSFDTLTEAREALRLNILQLEPRAVFTESRAVADTSREESERALVIKE